MGLFQIETSKQRVTYRYWQTFAGAMHLNGAWDTCGKYAKGMRVACGFTLPNK